MHEPNVDWSNVDTVFLDMDGTLLDLRYDNKVWNDLLPTAYSARHDMSIDTARKHLLSHMQDIRGSIEFYSFDYWAEFTRLDIVDLHRAATALVAYRPGAEAFLGWLNETQRRSIIATNAHRDSLMVKDEHSDICSRVHAVVSSHDYQAPKESRRFWQCLLDEQGFDAERTVFIDDTESVLHAAAEFGIRYNLGIRTPDSARPTRDDLSYPSFDHFAEICPELSNGSVKPKRGLE
jgi:putative hydrolase of the HAD superfamily